MKTRPPTTIKAMAQKGNPWDSRLPVSLHTSLIFLVTKEVKD